MGERIIADAFDAPGKDQRRQPATPGERRRPDPLHAAGNHHVRKSSTIDKGRISDAPHGTGNPQLRHFFAAQMQPSGVFNRIGVSISERNPAPRRQIVDVHRLQAGALVERVPPDSLHACRNRHRLQPRAFAERITPDVRHRPRNHHVRHPDAPVERVARNPRHRTFAQFRRNRQRPFRRLRPRHPRPTFDNLEFPVHAPRRLRVRPCRPCHQHRRRHPNDGPFYVCHAIVLSLLRLAFFHPFPVPASPNGASLLLCRSAPPSSCLSAASARRWVAPRRPRPPPRVARRKSPPPSSPPSSSSLSFLSPPRRPARPFRPARPRPAGLPPCRLLPMDLRAPYPRGKQRRRTRHAPRRRRPQDQRRLPVGRRPVHPRGLHQRLANPPPTPRTGKAYDLFVSALDRLVAAPSTDVFALLFPPVASPSNANP